MIWTAWPLAPFHRLSSAEVSTKLPVRGVVHRREVDPVGAHDVRGVGRLAARQELTKGAAA